MVEHRKGRPTIGRLSCWCVVLGLLVASLTGCALIASPTPTPEPVRIYFVMPDELADHYDELIETFNQQHADITVERRTAMTASTWDFLLSEGKVDAFAFSGEEGLFYGFYDEGRVLSLTPLIQESGFDLSDFYPGALEPFSMEGSLWAIPGGVNLGVTYYNKDLFDQYGAPYPQSGWTWDDLLAIGAEVSDPDQGVYGFVTFPFFVVPLVYQHGGRLIDDWRTPTRTTFDDPLTIEAIEWYASLIHDYRIAPAPAEAARLYGNDGNPAYIFWRRKAAMYGGFLSDRGGESWGPGARWQMQWGVVPLPVDAQASTLGFPLGYAISADTEHPRACWEWLTFLSEQLPPYVMPARRSLAESGAYEQRVGPEVAAVARSSIESALIVSNAPAAFEDEFEGFMQALNEIANGDLAAMEALTELQQGSAR